MLKTLSKKEYLKIIYLPKHTLTSPAADENIQLTNGVRKFEDIPGPKSYPIIGTLYKYFPFFGEYDIDAVDKSAWLNWHKYGGLVRECPGVRVLHIFEPDLIEAVFRQKERYPARRSHIAMEYYRVNKPEVHNSGGLLSTNGPEWWRIRSTFQKNFSSPQNAKFYVSDVDQVARKFIDWVKKSKPSYQDDFLNYINRLYLEVIGVVAFNEHFESFSPEEQDPKSRSSKLIKAAFESNSGIMKLDKGFLWKFFKTPLYRKLARSQEYLEKVSLDILLKRARFFEEEKENNDKSLLASFLLLPNVDLKDIRGIMVDILMAAVDTTSNSTSFALYHLARNEECQKKVFEELSLLMPDKDTAVTPDLISKAVYLKSCIKESLRLSPVAVGVGRVLQQDIVLKGYLIPKDTMIVTQNMVASRLPQYVKDPLVFRPERWIRDSDQYEVIHPFLSLPFGFGPRSCIARRLAEQNICITLMRLLREFDIKWRGGELGIKTLLINVPDKPLSFSFTARNM